MAGARWLQVRFLALNELTGFEREDWQRMAIAQATRPLLRKRADSQSIN